jgi:hypothetical protein
MWSRNFSSGGPAPVAIIRRTEGPGSTFHMHAIAATVTR